MWEVIGFVISGVLQTRHAISDDPIPTGRIEEVM